MEINKLTSKSIPPQLQQLSDPPKVLFASLTVEELQPLLNRRSVAVVGSRKVSSYGRQITTDIVSKLAAQGIVVISGLALGVDALAHQAALDAGGLTIAVLPSPLEKIYPASHRALAERIVQQGGALLSEYSAGTEVYRWNFIGRNRLVAGLADVLLITEAAEKSGSLHTANFALEQGKEVLAVPGNITSATSVGTNTLIKSGATPVTSYQDVLQALGLEEHRPITITGSTPEEQHILELLIAGTTDGESLQRGSQLPVAQFNQTLTMLEISGKIRSLGANQWTLS